MKQLGFHLLGYTSLALMQPLNYEYDLRNQSIAAMLDSEQISLDLQKISCKIYSGSPQTKQARLSSWVLIGSWWKSISVENI